MRPKNKKMPKGWMFLHSKDGKLLYGKSKRVKK